MKCQKHNGRLESERDNMAVAGILSTQLLDELLVSGNGYDFDIIPSEQIHVVHNSLQMI
jgi:hypothetical protein